MRYFNLLVWLTIALVAGCASTRQPGGTPANPATAPQSGTSLTQLPELPRDAYIDPAVIAARRNSLVTNFTVDGHAAWEQNAASQLDPLAGECRLAGAIMGWVIYRIPNLLPADNPSLLRVRLAGNLPDELWAGVADYGAQRWNLLPISTPAVENNLPLSQEMDVVSPGGNTYIALLVSAGETATIDAVELVLDYDAVPPANVMASTTDPAEIVVTWSPVAEYTPDAWRVERADDPGGPWSTLAELPAATTGYNDLPAVPENPLPTSTPFFYRVSAVIAGLVGPPSLIAEGLRPAQPPVAELTATPPFGPGPLYVQLDGSGSFDPNGAPITKHEWDWTDDGTWDHDSGSVTVANPPAYTQPGDNTARLRVTDADGATAEATVSLQVKTSPIADLTADVTSGDAPLTVTFDASGSFDPDGGKIRRYEWDWNDDGFYELDSDGEAVVTHTFYVNSKGTFDVTVRVEDDEGREAFASIELTVTASVGDWYHSLGGTYSESASAIAVDGAENILVLGKAGHSEAFSTLTKLNPEGDVLWSKTWQSPNPGIREHLRCMVLDAQDNAYVGGYLIDELSGNGRVAVLVKFDTNGNELWARTWKAVGIMNDEFTSMTLFEQHIYVVGYSYAGSFTQGLIAKYDPAGELIWDGLWGAETVDERFAEIKADSSLGLVISGLSVTAQGRNGFVLRASPATGVVLWTRQWTASMLVEENSTSCVIEPDNNITVGVHFGTGFSPLNSKAGVLRMSPAGHVLESHTWDLEGGVSPGRLVLAPDGTLFSTGFQVTGSEGNYFRKMLIVNYGIFMHDREPRSMLRFILEDAMEQCSFTDLIAHPDGSLMVCGGIEHVLDGDGLPDHGWEPIYPLNVPDDPIASDFVNLPTTEPMRTTSAFTGTTSEFFGTLDYGGGDLDQLYFRYTR